MSTIVIKFQSYFKDPMLAGIKTLTARTKRMGKPGDTFTAFDAQFELLNVSDIELHSVATMWQEEGCKSREGFIKVWNDLHPRKRYSDTKRVYLHSFKMVQP